MAARDGDAFVREEVGLDVGAAEGKSAGEATLGVDDTVTGNISLKGVVVEGVADGTGGARFAKE